MKTRHLLLASCLLAGCATVPAEAAVSYFSISDARADESAGQIKFVVRRYGITTTAKVRVRTTAGTATAPSDYTAIDQTLTFAPGESAKVVEIALNNDTIKESTETFSVRLTMLSNARLYDDGSATGVITDQSDTATAPPVQVSPPSFSVDDVTIAEGAPNAPVVVRKHGALNGQPSTVTLYTINGTAIAPGDYTQVQTTLTFAADETSKTVNIPLVDDSAPEEQEFFTVQITAGANARLYDRTAIITVSDSDVAPPPPPPPTTKTCDDGSVIPTTESCPTPPPPPMDPPDPPPGNPGQVDEPSPSLDGYTLLVAHNPDLDVAPAWGTGAIPPVGADPEGAYRQICGVSVLMKADPILYPGERGKGHLHDVNGSAGFDENSTAQSLLSGESRCNDQPGTGHASQHSAYWAPAILDGIGNVVRQDYAVIYYKRIPKTDPHCGNPANSNSSNQIIGICTDFPNGLKMIAGSLLSPGQYGPAGFRTDGGRQLYFRCYGGSVDVTKGNLQDLYQAAPVCPNLERNIGFPSCWDGKYLWKVDRSHIVYPSYGSWGYLKCPTSNPYLIPTVSVKYEFRTDSNWPTYKLACDDMDPTQKRGWCDHADAILDWDKRIKDEMHNNAINKRLNASGGDLGSGRQLKGAAQPSYGWTNPNRLIPISSLPSIDRPDGMGH